MVVVGKGNDHELAAKVDAGLNAFVGEFGTKKMLATTEGIGFGFRKPETPLPLMTWSFYQNADFICFIEGDFYDDYCSYRVLSGEDSQLAKILLRNFNRIKFQALEMVSGSFSGFIFDLRTRELSTFIDRLGVRILYWSYDNEELVVSTNLASLKALRLLHLDPLAAFQCLTIGFPIGERTLLKNVKSQVPCTVNVFSDGTKTSCRYWDPPKRLARISLGEAVESIVDSMEDFVARIHGRTSQGQTIGLGLTGGHDSRVVLSALAFNKVPFDVIRWREGNFNDMAAQELASRVSAELHVLRDCSASELKDIKEGVFLQSDGFCVHEWGFAALAKECAEQQINHLMLGFAGDVISGSLTIPEPECLNDVTELAKYTLRDQMELLSFEAARDLLRDVDSDVIENTKMEWVSSFAAEKWRESLSDVAIWQRLANRNLKRIRYAMIPGSRYAQLIFPYLDRCILDTYFRLPIKLIRCQKAHCYAGFYRYKEFGQYQATGFPISLATEARFALALYSLRRVRDAVGRFKPLLRPTSGGLRDELQDYVKEMCNSPLFERKHFEKLLAENRINPNTVYKMHTLSRFYDSYVRD